METALSHHLEGLCAAFATPAADHAAAADVQLRALAFYDACIQVRATGGSLPGAGELAGCAGRLRPRPRRAAARQR